jgi:hypothetical protein
MRNCASELKAGTTAVLVLHHHPKRSSAISRLDAPELCWELHCAPAALDYKMSRPKKSGPQK